MRKQFTLYPRTMKDGRIVWYARFLQDDGRRRAESTGERTRKAAEAWAQARLTRKRQAKTATLADFTTDFFIWNKCSWIAGQHAQGRPFSQPVAKDRRAHLVRYILPVFGKRRLAEIKPAQIRDFLVGLDLSNQSKNHVLNTFRIVMEEAVFRDFIEYNPAKNVRRFADDHKKRDIFTADELKRLFPPQETALYDVWNGPYWSTFFFVLLTAGVRLGEVRALLWSNVNLRLPAITVTQAVKADGSIGPPKSRERRAVYLPSRTSIMLENWRAASEYTAENDLVFYGKDRGRPIHQHTALDYFRKGLQAAGVDTRGRILVIHSLRHTYNSVMRRAISEAALHFMIGHTSTAMTDRYDQAGPLDKLQAFQNERKAIDDAWQ